MPSVGPNYSTTWSSVSSSPYSNDAWVNVAYLSSAATLATITAATYDANDWSYLAIGTGFGFSIASDQVIAGVQVDLRGRWDAGSATWGYASLRYSGAILGTADTYGTVLSSTLSTYGKGGFMTTWGASLTPAIVNDTTFGCAVAVQATSANTDISVDYVAMTVWYSPPPVSAGGAPFIGGGFF